jgi:hypothetical protein
LWGRASALRAAFPGGALKPSQTIRIYEEPGRSPARSPEGAAPHRREISEGTEEWDLLHKRYYAEEMKKLGIDLGSRQVGS